MSNQVPWLTKEYIQKFLLDPLKEKDLKVENFEVSPGSVAGDGYLSQIFRIKIKTTKKNISIIAKVLLTSNAVNTFENFLNVYDKEKLMLQTFLPRALEKSPKSGRFFPAFYHADDDKRTLFIEDLCDDGYQLAQHESNGLDLQHSLLVIEALAKLHSTSYLVLKENPSLLKHFDKYFWCEENKEFLDKMTRNTRESLIKALDGWNLAEEHKEKLRNDDDWTEKYIKTWERKDGQFNVVLQTDCWINNMMFKYNKTGVESIKLIDFQLGTNHSFALDLNFFIFSSTSPDVKINHLNTLIDRYYEVFTGITGNIPEFSKERLWKEFHERLFVGFFAAIGSAPIILAPATKKPTDLDAIMDEDAKDSMADVYKNPKFQDCAEKLFPYFVKHGAI